MTTMILFPYLNPWDLAKLSQVNKACKALLDSKSKFCVNYKHLYDVWGLETLDDQEILMPVSSMLSIAAELIILKSIVKS